MVFWKGGNEGRRNGRTEGRVGMAGGRERRKGRKGRKGVAEKDGRDQTGGKEGREQTGEKDGVNRRDEKGWSAGKKGGGGWIKYYTERKEWGKEGQMEVQNDRQEDKRANGQKENRERTKGGTTLCVKENNANHCFAVD